MTIDDCTGVIVAGGRSSRLPGPLVVGNDGPLHDADAHVGVGGMIGRRRAGRSRDDIIRSGA